MKKSINKINIILFVCVLYVFFILTAVLPPDLKTMEIENRELSKMPETIGLSSFSSGYTKQIEAFIADRVAFRSNFVLAAKRLEGLTGMTFPNEARIVMPGDKSVTAGSGLIEPIKPGYLLEFTDKIMEIFVIDRDSAKNYADVLNGYREALPEDIRIYSMLIPTQVEFTGKRFKSVTDSQEEAVSIVNGILSEGIRVIDSFGTLRSHYSEYVYFRTDHHWTALGAYYVYREFCAAAGVTPIALYEYNANSLPGFLGFLYNSRPSEGLKNNQDTITYYVLKDETFTTTHPLIFPPAADEPARYSVFLGSDWDLYNIETSVLNGRTAVIIKDSYANCLIPFLAPHYQNLIIIDPRYFEGSVTEEIAKYGDADLIFINYVFATTFEDLIQRIDTIR